MSEAEHLSRAMRGFFSDLQNGWFPPFVESIDGLTAAQVSWIPGEGLRSIWEISNHVRFYHQLVLLQLQKQPIDRAKLGSVDGWPPAGHPGDGQAWQDVIRQVESANDALASFVAGLGPDTLITPLREGGPSPWQVLQGLIAHTAYHTGQAVLIRRLQGSWIVDWRERRIRH